MGMAASQARYLGLTARKTNVEYEGQQINQARTALGNQSASLWNQMLGLTIPTVPSITNYTTLQYSFNDGINVYTISDMQSVDKKDADGSEYNKLVTYYFYEDVYKGVETTNSNPQVQKVTKSVVNNATDKISRNGTDFTTADGYTITYDANPLDVNGDEYKKYAEAYKNSNGTDFTGNLYSYSYVDGNGNTITRFMAGAASHPLDGMADPSIDVDLNVTSIGSNTAYKLGNSEATVVDGSDLVDKTAVDQIIHDFGKAGGITQEMLNNGQVYKYVKNGNTYYTTLSELEKCIAGTKHDDKEYAISSGIDFQPSLTHYYATTIKEKMENTDYAIMDDASGSGRFSNMKLKNMSTKFELKAEEKTNQDAYNDAMNQYNYDLTQYEKRMSDINAKTSLIQEQDRTLELRLKQLDTEQKALTTEMDAVKGVLQKNVESTFGTFK